ncbi:DUF4269 domain-containing protein [Maricaulis sp.]|uniref:DUF4269 domain-containing protein n=1 Tax=Maricaulis sp. TaxID=1486257 RepID=UPI002632B73A|nr:DUF4269 domain-containing protein [Maricaulis sp.]
MDQPPIPVTDARALLDRHRIFEMLAPFDPRWVGSIPLDIHNDGADADICCSAVPDLPAFKEALATAFPDARINPNTHAGEASIIASLEREGLPIEIYGRVRPVETHESYIHWLAEHRLLGLAEDRLRSDVRAVKATGLKTEPAFAQCLKLGGEPYSELLKLASPGDAALRQIIENAGYRTR